MTVRILDIPTSLIDFNGQTWVQDMVNNVLIEVLGAIAEQERIKIRTRQAEGIKAKRERGDWADYGRPKAAVTHEDVVRLSKSGKSVVECCK